MLAHSQYLSPPISYPANNLIALPGFNSLDRDQKVGVPCHPCIFFCSYNGSPIYQAEYDVYKLIFVKYLALSVICPCFVLCHSVDTYVLQIMFERD